MQSDHPIRRRFSPEFKANLVAQCHPGISVSAVALENGINANQLRRWIREHEGSKSLPAVSRQPALVPIAVTAPVPGQFIEVNIRKAGAQVNIRLPVDCADTCARWMEAWLK